MYWGLAVLVALVAVLVLAARGWVLERRVREYRGVLDGIPTGVLVVVDGVIEYANREARVAGGDLDIVGRRVADVVRSSVLVRAEAAIAGVIAGGEPVAAQDVPLLNVGDDVVPYDVLVAATVYEGKAAVEVLLLRVDERQRSAKALQESEDRFRCFFAEMPVPMYRTRPSGEIVHANRALANLLGATDPGDLVGVNAATFYADRAERARLAALQATDGLLENHVSLLRTLEGTAIWVRDSSRMVEEATGKIFEGAMVDITAGHNAERELQVRAHQQEALAYIAQVALRSPDVERALEEAADRITAVLGIDTTLISLSQDGQGLLAATVSHNTAEPGHRERILAYLEAHAALAIGSPYPTPLPPEVGFDEGSVIRGLALAITGTHEVFGVIGVGGCCRPELTIEDENFLVAVAATLGSAIERSRSRSRLERLMRSKDEFIASVSHELRTPLTVVVGMAVELERSWQSFSAAEVAEFVGLIADQSREMSNLIEDLLVAARADIGKIPIRLVETKLMDNLEQVVFAFAKSDRDRVQIEGADIVADVDPVRFRQILRNLISNAIRYGGDEIKVTIKTQGSDVVVSVYDNGVGIPHGMRERVFDPYARAHSSDGVPNSVGLGLTVSRQLAGLMGGKINYRFDTGSFFELRLPIHS